MLLEPQPLLQDTKSLSSLSSEASELTLPQKPEFLRNSHLAEWRRLVQKSAARQISECWSKNFALSHPHSSPLLPPLVTRALNSKSRDEQISPTPIFPPHMTPKGVGGIVSTERHDKTQEQRETSFSNFASPTQPSPRCIQLKLPNLQPPPAPPPPFPE